MLSWGIGTEQGVIIMRKLLVALAAVVIGATGFTAYTMAAAPITGHAVAAPIDPTMSAPQFLAQPSDYPNCAQWPGLRYGVIRFSGVSTHYYRGCVNPAQPGTGDSFTGRITGYLAIAAKG